MARKLKWAMLGASRMARVMLPNLLLAENGELVAVASRRPGAARKLVAEVAPERLREIRCYDAPEQLLANREVEAVYLPVANEEHAPFALQVLHAGKHVLIEKPLALDPQEVAAIRAEAERRGLKVMEGFMYRFHPQHERVLELIREGILGEVRTVYATFSFPMVPARLYRISRPIERGGGALWDVGCYAVHVSRWFLGALPRAVLGIGKFNEHGADTQVAGLLDFGDGRYAHLQFGYEQARKAEYQLIGTEGGVTCHNVWAKPDEIPLISWWRMDGRRGEEALPRANHFKLELERFAEAVLRGEEPPLSLQDAEENCLVLNALLEAIRTGRAVVL